LLKLFALILPLGLVVLAGCKDATKKIFGRDAVEHLIGSETPGERKKIDSTTSEIIGPNGERSILKELPDGTKEITAPNGERRIFKELDHYGTVEITTFPKGSTSPTVEIRKGRRDAGAEPARGLKSPETHDSPSLQLTAELSPQFSKLNASIVEDLHNLPKPFELDDVKKVVSNRLAEMSEKPDAPFKFEALSGKFTWKKSGTLGQVKVEAGEVNVYHVIIVPLAGLVVGCERSSGGDAEKVWKCVREVVATLPEKLLAEINKLEEKKG
jgi:hypothetical protein